MKRNRLYPSLQKHSWGNYHLRGINKRSRRINSIRQKEMINHTQEYCDGICVLPIMGFENSIVGEQCQVCGKIF